MNHLVLFDSIGSFMLVEIVLEHFIASSTGECSLSCDLPCVPIKEVTGEGVDLRVLHLEDVEGRWGQLTALSSNGMVGRSILLDQVADGEEDCSSSS